MNTIHNIILNTMHNIRPRICSIGRNQNSALSLFMIYQGICSKSYTAGTNSGSAGTAYPSESPSLPPGYYSGVNFAKSFVFYAMLCRSLFVFFFLLAVVLSVLRLRTTPLISSNFSSL